MTKKVILGIMALAVFGCKSSSDNALQQGSWLAELELMDGALLPFNFDLNRKDGAYSIKVFNAEEVVEIDDIEIRQDSIYIRMAVFEGYIAGKFNKETITGSFIKESLNRIVPFKARYGKAPRFSTSLPAAENISGIWQTQFNPDTEDSYLGKGLFVQQDQIIKGTFRTTTGDYRYLEGVMEGDSMRLSTFDGAHAFLFTAKVTDSSLAGIFYSGNHSKEPFVAVRNEHFELPDANTLTYLKEGYDKFDFSFPNEKGALIALSDADFKDKTIVVQIMGTWCPNCLDESKFLVNYLKQNSHPDLKIIALAFEYAKTEEKAFEGIQRLRERVGVEYPVLLAQYGTSNKVTANEKLPMLNHVLSYPTTIFIDKTAKVRKIHTGFNGPATGAKYVAFTEDFDNFIKELLAE